MVSGRSHPSAYSRRGCGVAGSVIAPNLYDVILKNVGKSEFESLYVTVMAQEI